MNKRIISLNVEVDSSVIQSLEYNPRNRSLGVKYKRGKYKGQIKHYEGVGVETFWSIINASSVGRKIISHFHEDKQASLEIT